MQMRPPQLTFGFAILDNIHETISRLRTAFATTVPPAVFLFIFLASRHLFVRRSASCLLIRRTGLADSMLSAVIGTGPYMSRGVSWHAFLDGLIHLVGVGRHGHEVPAAQQKIKADGNRKRERLGVTTCACVCSQLSCCCTKRGAEQSNLHEAGKGRKTFTSAPQSAKNANLIPTLRI